MTGRAWPGRPAAPSQDLFAHNLQPNPHPAAFLGTLACVVLLTTVPCAWAGPGLCGRRDSRAWAEPPKSGPPTLPDPQLHRFRSRAGRHKETNSVQPPVLQAVCTSHSLVKATWRPVTILSLQVYGNEDSGRFGHLPRRYMASNAKLSYKARSVTLQPIFYAPPLPPVPANASPHLSPALAWGSACD